MGNIRTLKLVAAASTILFLACFSWALIVQLKNGRLGQKLDREMLRYETLLSEKVSFGADEKRSRRKADFLSEENARLREMLEHRTKTVTTQTFENREIKKALKYYTDEYNQETDNNRELRNLLSQEKESFGSLRGVNKVLKDSVNMLVMENIRLANEIEDAKLQAIDETLVTAVKKNRNKITAKARRAKKLVARVDLPGNPGDISFTVEGPDGSILSDNGSVTSKVIADPEWATASLKSEPLAESLSRKFEIVYTPDDKLEPGIYVIKIFNAGQYIAAMKVKLE